MRDNHEVARTIRAARGEYYRHRETGRLFRLVAMRDGFAWLAPPGRRQAMITEAEFWDRYIHSGARVDF